MLVLSRRAGEALKIGAEVTVTVLGVRHNQVRLGVHAPRSVAVHREEVYERIQAERAEGVQSQTPGDVRT
jgi:carbon storage regulator